MAKEKGKESLGGSKGGLQALFVRQSTGLVKNVSFLNSIAVNVSYMSIGAALALIGFTMVALPTVSGVNLVYGSAIAAVLAIPQMLVYRMMQTRVSRTGGDYVWISRSLGGFLGSTLTFMGITLETMPYLALIALSAVFAVGSVSAIIGNSPLAILAVPGAAPLPQFILGSVIVAALIGVNIFRPRYGFKLISIFWIVGVVTVAISVLALIVAGREGVANYIDSLHIANTTYTSISNSYQQGSTTTAFDFQATLLILPFFALFSYPWFNAAPSVGSELRGRRAVAWNAPVSLLIAFLLLAIPFATMYYVGGFGFTNAALSNPTLVEDYSFNFWTLAMGVSNNNLFLKLIIGVGWIVFTLAILAFGIITISRYLLAQAFDRFLPEKIAYVSPKYGSPVLAHLLDLVITLGLIGLASFLYGTMSSLYGAVVASMIYFAFVGLAALVYALSKERALRTKLTLAIAGLLQILVFAYLTYEFFAYPEVWGGNPLAYGYIAAIFMAGVVIYFISKRAHARRGIDISLAFKELPPE
ncbi:MAG TPA: APC family permease [Nitrososphaerales archaeon]|nr:APC family permease [Nitrososphaerales archaeon]